MHREHPVEDLRRNKIVVRVHQLDANDQRFNAGDHEEAQGVEDIENAEPFVIDRGHPLVQGLCPWLCRALEIFNGDRIR